jgi:acetolactate synthase I/II/III large subunit
MKAVELVVRCLENEGVEFLFALPGEETLHLTDACNPDFVKLAQSFGAGGMRVTSPIGPSALPDRGVCLRWPGRH